MSGWALPLAILNTILAVANVVLISGLQRRSERQSWLRDQRLVGAMELKVAVASTRARFSRQARGDAAVDDFDFSELNGALARVEMVGPSQVAGEVEELRIALREFIRSANDSGSEWAARRARIDSCVDRILKVIRSSL